MARTRQRLVPLASSSVLLGWREAIARLRELTLGEREHLRRSDGEHECRAALVMERVAFDHEVPVAVVLGAPEVGQLAQSRGVRHAYRGAFDHDVESVLPLVASRREHHVWIADEVHRLLLLCTRAEVEVVLGPNRRQWCDVGPAVTANRGDPEQLGGLEHPANVGPRRGRRGWIAETDVFL